MKTTLLLVSLALALVGCGSTDPIFWEKCDGPPCHTDGASRWDLVADGGSVDGSHDFIGPPDPYLCLTIGDDTECSGEVSDSNDPRWRDRLFSDIAASTFVDQPIAVGYWDSDTGTWLDDDDRLCSGTLTITTADLEKGGVEWNCPEGKATITFNFVE